ncbi:MAG: ATP-binding protein [Bryobacteraceae bacterium]|jgi:signal transduction histidine kinase
MKPRLEFVLLAGFGSMMLLSSLLGFSQIRRSAALQRELIEAQERYAATERLVSDLRADLYRISLDLRDFLLDRDAADSAAVREEIVEARQRILRSLDELERSLGPAAGSGSIARLRERVESFFTLLGPPLEWKPEVKLALGGSYVRRVLLGRRAEISLIAGELQALNYDNLKRSQQRLLEAQQDFRRRLNRLTYSILVLSAIVAVASIWWIFRLEQRARAAEREMRQLSQKLVQAQEAERKRLSLELHDQVGQMLTALRMEIANLGRLGEKDPQLFRDHLQQAKELAEATMKTVRDLAMGLRPSMLDDLGLGPAIEWIAREFSRVSGIPVDVSVEGSLGRLTDAQKTSLFRVVQESLTNVARHARAKHVSVRLTESANSLALVVSDDGKGIEPGKRRRGLGLLGMEERIRELGGTFLLSSAPGAGTTVRVEIPLAPMEVEA